MGSAADAAVRAVGSGSGGGGSGASSLLVPRTAPRLAVTNLNNTKNVKKKKMVVSSKKKKKKRPSANYCAALGCPQT